MDDKKTGTMKRMRHSYFQARFEEAEKKLGHSLKTLSQAEFAGLLQSKTTQPTAPQATHLSDNLFPSLKQTPFSLTQESVYRVFVSPSSRATAPETRLAAKLASAPPAEETHFLDWLTVVMAQMHRRSHASYLIPRTLYVRPRATWPRTGHHTRPAPRTKDGPNKLFRTFQWHMLNSHVRFDNGADKESSTRKVLLAVVTTWRSATSPPTTWGYWTYIRADGDVQLFPSTGAYREEKQAMRLATRIRSFDLEKLYRMNHLTVAAESYGHLALGQFIALMVSAEFHPEQYSPTVLDHYATQFILHLLPSRPKEKDDHAAAVRVLLHSMVPMVDLSVPLASGTDEAFSATFGYVGERTPYEYAVTPSGIASLNLGRSTTAVSQTPVEKL